MLYYEINEWEIRQYMYHLYKFQTLGNLRLNVERLSLGNMKLIWILMSYYINDGDMAVRIVTGNKLIKEGFFTSPPKYFSFIVVNLNDSRHTGWAEIILLFILLDGGVFV